LNSKGLPYLETSGAFLREQGSSQIALTPLEGSFYIVRISQKGAQDELYAKYCSFRFELEMLRKTASVGGLL
jgi:hypothetical protein